MREFWKRYQVGVRLYGGFSCGVLINLAITLIISLCHGEGEYWPAMPALRAHFAQEITAVWVQYLLTGLVGVVFALSAIIFMEERHGFLWHYVCHFLVTACVYVPFLWLCYMPEHIGGLWALVGTVFANYLIIFFVQYALDRRLARAVNAKLEEAEHVGD